MASHLSPFVHEHGKWKKNNNQNAHDELNNCFRFITVHLPAALSPLPHGKSNHGNLIKSPPLHPPGLVHKFAASATVCCALPVRATQLSIEKKVLGCMCTPTPPNGNRAGPIIQKAWVRKERNFNCSYALTYLGRHGGEEITIRATRRVRISAFRTKQEEDCTYVHTVSLGSGGEREKACFTPLQPTTFTLYYTTL